MKTYHSANGTHVSVRARRTLSAISVAALVSASAPASAQSFQATSTCLGGPSSIIGSINVAGHAAGYSRMPDAQIRATFISPGVLLDLDPLGLHDRSAGSFLNSSDCMLGFFDDGGRRHAFAWTSATGMVDLTPAADMTQLHAINEAGQMAALETRGTNRFLLVRTPDGASISVLLGSYGEVNAMNAAGQVIGVTRSGADPMQAYSWTLDGGLVKLTPGMYSSRAQFLNESGKVVGAVKPTPGSLEKLFVWTATDGLQVVAAPTPDGQIYATDMDEAGNVVGWYGQSADRVCFLRKPGGALVEIPSLGIPLASPNHINASGVVTGLGSNRAFVWTETGGTQELSFGGSRAVVVDVDDNGKVVGWAYNAAGARRAFAWTSTGGMVDLGSLGGAESVADAILADGRVVGWSSLSGNGAQRAFIHDGVVMTDLNTLIVDPPGGVVFESASLPRAYLPRSSFVARADNKDYLISPAGPPPAAPVVDLIAALPDPVWVGAPLSVSASFTDANTSDTHSATWRWSDGTPDVAGVVSESAGTGGVSGMHAFLAAGVYTISLTLTDSTNRTVVTTRNVVVYDPSAGFVTGGGWFAWPAGAFTADPGRSGKANISLVTRYEKGAGVPTGNLELQLHADHLKFTGTTFDWLVVSGARAQCEGTGTIDGGTSCKFLLTVIDGDLVGRRVADRVRIKIWYFDEDLEDDVVLFDNHPGAEEGTLLEGAELGGGSIVIHSGKG